MNQTSSSRRLNLSKRILQVERDTKVAAAINQEVGRCQIASF